jgi:hypothetical protein
MDLGEGVCKSIRDVTDIPVIMLPYGGEITVKSISGKGTSFRLLIISQVLHCPASHVHR